MQKIYRLTQKSSFNYIYRKGLTVSTPRMIMRYVPAKNVKIGIVVGKKVGNSVVRSRVKRRIKERIRLLIPFMENVNNYVIVALSACADADSSQINDDLLFMLKKIGVYSENKQ